MVVNDDEVASECRTITSKDLLYNFNDFNFCFDFFDKLLKVALNVTRPLNDFSSKITCYD